MATDWLALCLKLVPDILRERDWHLIAAEDLPAFVTAVCQAIEQGVVKPVPGVSPELTVRRATIHLYCYELYRASGEDRTPRQHRAFEEIGQHALRVAYRYERDTTIVQDSVQQALLNVWQKREQVRQPGSFLRWIEKIVCHEVKNRQRQNGRKQEIPVSRLRNPHQDGIDDESLLRYWESLATVRPPDEDVICHEQREKVRSEVYRALAGNARYEAVIVGYFLYELSLPALAQMLGTTVSNVYVLKSRALARLRSDEEFVRQFAGTLAELSGGKP